MASRLWGSTPTVGSSRIRTARLVEESDADVEPTFHPAREVASAIVGPVGQPDRLHDLVDPRRQRATAEAVEPTEEPQVLHGRQIGVDGQVLGHVADRSLHDPGLGVEIVTDHLHDAAISSEQAAQHRDGGGLARTVRAQQTIRLAGGDREANVVDHRPLAVALDQPSALKHIARHNRSTLTGNPTPRSNHTFEPD